MPVTVHIFPAEADFPNPAHLPHPRSAADAFRQKQLTPQVQRSDNVCSFHSALLTPVSLHLKKTSFIFPLKHLCQYHDARFSVHNPFSLTDGIKDG